MGLESWHREDVKALLRRRYGSVGAFEQAKGLPRASVSDVLRGRTVARTTTAILEELNKPDLLPAEGDKAPCESDLSDDTTGGLTLQRYPPVKDLGAEEAKS